MQNVYKTYMFARRAHKLMHEKTTFSKENKGAAFGRAPQGRGAPLWLFSLISLVFLYILPTILVIGMVIQELGL